MDTPTNTGSFGSAAGGVSPELAAAIQRRSNPGQGATGAVTQGSASYNPATQPATPPTGAPPMPSAPPMPPTGQPMPSQTPSSNPLPFAGQDAISTIDALSKFLKALQPQQPTM